MSTSRYGGIDPSRPAGDGTGRGEPDTSGPSGGPEVGSGVGSAVGSGVGALVLAATPLGNPADASPRLRDALATADVVAAEDTRRLARLAAVLDVRVGGTVVSFYDDVEQARIPRLVAAVRAGETVLVVSDAGMPVVSDPGYRLVAACAAEGLPVQCLPGPSAVLTALAVSGLPTDRFCFEGFAPRADGKRRTWLAALAQERRTAVFFESPRRVASLLAVAVDVLGAERPAVLCRELTKTHEETVRGTVGTLATWAAGRDVLGEVTVVLGPAQPPTIDTGELALEVLGLVEDGRRLKDAAREVATAHGVSTRELYEAALRART